MNNNLINVNACIKDNGKNPRCDCEEDEKNIFWAEFLL